MKLEKEIRYLKKKLSNTSHKNVNLKSSMNDWKFKRNQDFIEVMALRSENALLKNNLSFAEEKLLKFKGLDEIIEHNKELKIYLDKANDKI